MLIQPPLGQGQRQSLVIRLQGKDRHSALGAAHAEDQRDAQDAGQPDRLASRDGTLLLQRFQLEFVPLVEQQGRQQLLLRGGETRHVDVVDDVGGVLRRLLVLDAQTDLVQQGRVTQDRATVALGETPGRLQLGERLDGGIAYPLGVLLVQLVAADQAVGGTIAGITVVIVAEQAVD